MTVPTSLAISISKSSVKRLSSIVLVSIASRFFKVFKNSTKGKERMMALDPKSGATTSYEVVFEGTWAVPKSINDKNKLKDLLKKPIKLGKEGDDA